MSDQGSTWPEQDAVDAWFKRFGFDQFPLPHDAIMELKQAVTAPRIAMVEEASIDVKDFSKRNDVLREHIATLEAELAEAFELIHRVSIWEHGSPAMMAAKWLERHKESEERG